MEVNISGTIVKKTDEISAKEYFLICFKRARYLSRKITN